MKTSIDIDGDLLSLIQDFYNASFHSSKYL